MHNAHARWASGARWAQRRATFWRLVVAQGKRLVLFGLVVGFISALVLNRFIEKLLFGVRSKDPLTYGVIGVVFIAVGLFACWLPARRATKVDPLIVLRSE